MGATLSHPLLLLAARRKDGESAAAHFRLSRRAADRRGAQPDRGRHALRPLLGHDRGSAPSPFRALLLPGHRGRSEEHTSELQSLMRISYAVFCLKKKK